MSVSRIMVMFLVFIAGFALLIWGGLSCHSEESEGDSKDKTGDDDTVPSSDNFQFAENPSKCGDYNEYRNLYFGDLHAHTGLSFDAYGYEVRATAEEAYAFAKGGQIHLSPLDENGNGTRPVRLTRPLDFVALSDHLEYFAEVTLCTTEGSLAYDTKTCRDFRDGGQLNVTKFGIRYAFPNPTRFKDICTESGADCEQVIKDTWEKYVQSAQKANDHSDACSFVAFPAYEYTGTPFVSNLHRNVIFRNENVPKFPPSYFEQPSPIGLWKELKENCLDAENDCDVILIPHNSNWSNGKLFMPDYGDAQNDIEQRDIANLRARMEPLVEIMQHKGDMECKNGFEGIPADPYCDFEKFRESDFTDCKEGTGMGGANSFGCLSRYDYLRSILNLGLREKSRIGVNPYRLGVIGSTDTHNGIPGKTSEDDYPGHVGSVDDTDETNLSLGTITHTPLYSNPGGLAAVWATENSRDALFEAFRRREVYSTSGPRIEVRFFGGWEFAENLPDDPDFVQIAYEQGVPMGAVLPEKPSNIKKPVFALVALADPGTKEHPGTALQQIQIIKGRIDAFGEPHEKVFVAAGEPDNQAGANPKTCEQEGEGFSRLSAFWTDPEFDPALQAFYYVRVLENPSCRWSLRLCNKFEPENRPEECSDPEIQAIIQERALSSPIWYEP